MEKIQWEYHSNKNKNLWLASIVGSLVLSACSSTPVWWTYNKNEKIVQPNIEPAKVLISKTHTHIGPLGDKICTLIYSNWEKVLQLCEPKANTVISTFRKNIPAKTEQIPAKTIQKPGTGVRLPDKIETKYEYHYGINPSNGKYEYRYGPHTVNTPGKYIPPEFIRIPPRTEHTPAYSVLCQEFVSYDTVSGKKNPPQITCENSAKK